METQLAVLTEEVRVLRDLLQMAVDALINSCEEYDVGVTIRTDLAKLDAAKEVAHADVQAFCVVGRKITFG